MNLNAKKFEELSVNELYEILKSRSEIFLLEQNIICQDLDNIDYSSLHCFFKDNERVVAYLRAYVYDENEKIVKIGRVLTLKHGNGIGGELFQKSISEIKKQFDFNKIIISAQKQAVGFYEKNGFSVVSDEYIEDGVIHLMMERKF